MFFSCLYLKQILARLINTMPMHMNKNPKVPRQYAMALKNLFIMV
jgi:hypothetical protein